MGMWTVHQMLAFYWNKSKHGKLTEQEKIDFKLCLDANLNKCREVANLENLSLVAASVEDVEWQHEICAEIEKAIPHYCRPVFEQ